MATSQYEQALFFAARNGNNKCFEELYRIHADAVYALLRMSLPGAEDAERAMEDCFWEAWQRLTKLTNGASFDLWLMRLALEQCGGFPRMEAAPIEPEPELLLPASCVTDAALRRRIGQAIFRQSTAHQQTAVLAWYDALQPHEVAAVMGCDTEAVEARLSELRRAVREELGEDGQGPRTLTLGDFLREHAPGLALPEETREAVGRRLAARILGGMPEENAIPVEEPAPQPQEEWREFIPAQPAPARQPPVRPAAEQTVVYQPAPARQKKKDGAAIIWLLGAIAGLLVLLGIVLLSLRLLRPAAEPSPAPVVTESPAETLSAYIGDWVWEDPYGVENVELRILRMSDDRAYGSLTIGGVVDDPNWEAALDSRSGGSFVSAGTGGTLFFGSEGISLNYGGKQYALTRSDYATVEIGD